MINWQIHYDDGSTFDNTIGELEQDPDFPLQSDYEEIKDSPKFSQKRNR